ncbi:hypothetical protein CP02DC15_1094A, partial [Chlamydia psittaci 02DC15]
MKPVLGGS